ncbi:MAG: ATP-binding protein [Paludibacteraceae bacterium]|nr:ATP-binding protein [Paludibacteraceae bacterium]
MKYEVAISKEAQDFFAKFEEDFDAEMQKLANEPRFLHLKLGISMRIVQPTINDKVYALVCNASYSIDRSRDFQAEASMYLEEQKEILVSILNNKALLVVQISFSAKSKPLDGTKSSEESTDYDEKTSPFLAKAPIYTLEQMVLPEELLTEMKAAINTVKYQKLIYEDWGFLDVDPIPKCVLNFYGPPGTGKTMAAHALASSIGKKIMEANYGDIESKFVGDAPKNMKKVFERAKEEDCVLFFDEADSVMGKRMNNASNGAEQAINSLRSETLKHLEQHNGIVIMATNLVTTFDPAFKSRILKSLKFELPNKAARIDIIKKKTPSKMPIDAPLTEDQLSELSEIADGMSGREIKNCFIDMAQRKANDCGESAIFTFEDFQSAFRRQKEMSENLKREETREKEEKILNALKPKTTEEAKGRIQSLLEDKTQEEREEIMDYVYSKLEEVDNMRKEIIESKTNTEVQTSRENCTTTND